ncbi:MAG: heat-inducible transcription repressor HrcA [Alicyclobacillus sp. RIFOXYA1_FULL_53_8]|nr:MAG: heat-inducible transcription repressor HrcA [Alicyclobacillus sp. RIFOXYA1_FULL_53_8]
MLTNRQRLILNAVVEDYVRSAEPVGSRTLSKHGDITFSPATIRNEMADLEEMGYLDQPHTSAGRIPSQKGYRFYVDHLGPGLPAVEPITLSTLREHFRQKINEVERVIQQTATVLSELTQYTSIVLGPQVQQGSIKQVQLVPLGAGRAVVILVSDTGAVYNRQVQLPEDTSIDDVMKLVNLLSERLRGVPLSHLRSRLFREISNEFANTLEHYEDVLAMLDELLQTDLTQVDRLYVGGTTHMLAQPEFRDVDKVKPVLELLESAKAAQSVLPNLGAGIAVRIGRENHTPSLQDCTVISATYTMNGVPVGSVGVLGPTRMNYARVMQILDYASHALTQVMTDRLRDP